MQLPIVTANRGRLTGFVTANAGEKSPTARSDWRVGAYERSTYGRKVVSFRRRGLRREKQRGCVIQPEALRVTTSLAASDESPETGATDKCSME
jgi:hypothetical protein